MTHSVNVCFLLVPATLNPAGVGSCLKASEHTGYGGVSGGRPCTFWGISGVPPWGEAETDRREGMRRTLLPWGPTRAVTRAWGMCLKNL